jgi:hypothetical protein
MVVLIVVKRLPSVASANDRVKRSPTMSGALPPASRWQVAHCVSHTFDPRAAWPAV